MNVFSLALSPNVPCLLCTVSRNIVLALSHTRIHISSGWVNFYNIRGTQTLCVPITHPTLLFLWPNFLQSSPTPESFWNEEVSTPMKMAKSLLLTYDMSHSYMDLVWHDLNQHIWIIYFALRKWSSKLFLKPYHIRSWLLKTSSITQNCIIVMKWYHNNSNNMMGLYFLIPFGAQFL